ncbi:MAG TPA: cytochrome c maturation protein CcmE [Thermoanaerobaculia bacterium]|nr:cytochrome c maturation protein CcmE [Thermoanaerobaculia bacterium]
MSDVSSSASRTKNRRPLFAVGAITVALVAFVVITAGGIGENLVYYWGPTELHDAGDKAVGASIRLGGQVRPGSIAWDGQSSNLAFDVTDGKQFVHVKSQGVPPQMFREGIGVVVEGTMTDGGHFESNRLMVSHDNEYRAPGEGEQADTKELMSTTKGVDAEAAKGSS